VRRLRLWCLALACWLAAPAIGGPAWAANFDVATDAQLRSAITTAANGDTITFTANITLAADLPAVQKNVTILGNGNTLSGANQFRGLFVGAWTPGTGTQVAVTVGIQDLTITSTKASGGNGGAGSAGSGGGGGAGLGGAIFNHNGTLTISNSTFANNGVYGGFDAGGGGNGVALGSAIFNLQGGVAIQDSTLALNITAGANAGGAVYDLGYLRNDDGGKWYLQSNIDIQNSILANSSDLSGPSSDLVTNAPSTLTGGAANIATSTVTLDSTDITVTRNAFGNGTFDTSAGMPIAADPQLGPLQYNGGPTPTMAPSSGRLSCR